MANFQSKAKWIVPPPVGGAMGWATGASAGAPPPAAWTMAGIVDWLSVPFHWSFVFIGMASGLGTLFALHRFIHPEPKSAPNDDILAEIQKLRLELLAQNPAGAQQVESFVTTATDLAGSESAEDRSIAREAVEGDPLAASDRLMAEVEVGVAEQAERARQAARIAAPFSVAKAITAYARAVELDPSDFGTWIELSRLHQAAGPLTDARRTAEAALQHSTNDRERAVAEHDLGDIAVVEGQLDAAKGHFQSFLSASQAGADANPDDVTIQRDLSISHVKLGDVAVAQGDLAGARAAYGAGLAIRERLAASDPGNAGWQFDLGISNERLGDVALAQGDLEAAKTSHQKRFEIIERLAASDPGNAGWQRDLSVSHNKLGDVAVAQGDLAGARAAYGAGLAIRERLAASDPGNAGWQRDVFVSHDRMARIAEASDDVAGAIREFEAGEAILAALLTRVGDHPGFVRDMANVRGDIARLRGE